MRQAVVLCGGLGTRLRSVVADVPKPMAPISGRPFLEILLNYLAKNSISSVILATGYKSEIISSHFGASWAGMDVFYSVETTPLGTGGALRQALRLVADESAIVVNGDSFLAAPLSVLREVYDAGGSPLAMTLKPEQDCSRYGVCDIEEGRIVGFAPSRPGPGLINAGVYAVSTRLFDGRPQSDVFSFERDFLEPHAPALNATAVVADAPFIDIGLPESFAFAQAFLPKITTT